MQMQKLAETVPFFLLIIAPCFLACTPPQPPPTPNTFNFTLSACFLVSVGARGLKAF